MKRRDFLLTAFGAAALQRCSWAADLPRDVTIARIVGFTLPTKRNKIAGKNSHLDVHGDRSGDRMVRLFTNAGLEGLGNCRADEKALASLLGKDPFALYQPSERRMTGPLGVGTMPLWDLAGKALKKPAWELLGGAGPERVPVYDGSIYMQDLLPQHADRWADRFKVEIDMGMGLGHRAFKIKIGRGFKWMPQEAGDARDAEVVQLIRRHAGPDVVLGVDSNNGHDLARTKRFLEAVPGANLAFLEEMFPENIEQYTDLRRFLADRRLKALIADGENWGAPEDARPFVDAKVVDVYQGDMNRFGFEGVLAAAALAAGQGFTIGPHNWGSLVGFYMQLHAGRAVPNFYRAEHDPLESDVLLADAYVIREGRVYVPDAPGFGLAIDEAQFAATIKPAFDLKA